MSEERLDDPAWPVRVQRLASVMRGTMHVADVCATARKLLGWKDQLTVGTLAAGEKTVFASRGADWSLIGPVAVRARQVVEVGKRECAPCGGAFSPRHPKQKYCSGNCRQAAFVMRKAG